MILDPNRLAYAAKVMLRNKNDISIYMRTNIDPYIANGYYLLYDVDITDARVIKIPLGIVNTDTRQSNINLMIIFTDKITAINKVMVPDAMGSVFYISPVPEDFFDEEKISYTERVKYIYDTLTYIINDNISLQDDSIYTNYYRKLPVFIITKELIDRTVGELNYDDYTILLEDVPKYDSNVFKDVLIATGSTRVPSMVADMFFVNAFTIDE